MYPLAAGMFSADVTTVRSCPVLLGVEAEGAVPGGVVGGGGGDWGAAVWIIPIILHRLRWCVQAAARSPSFIRKKTVMELYVGIVNAPWVRFGVRFAGMSFRPSDWSGSGMRAAFTLMVSILVSGTTPGSPLHLEPQVLWTSELCFSYFMIKLKVFEITVSGVITNGKNLQIFNSFFRKSLSLINNELLVLQSL